MKVSVIIPVYNVEQYLHHCVDSVLGQTYQNLEVILVDDGSTDGCPGICDDYARMDSRVRVIHKENSGASEARKSGIAVATAEYIMFLDGDDWIDLDTVSYCVCVAYRDDADCVMFGYMREYPNRSIINELFKDDYSWNLEESEDRVHRRLVGVVGEELRCPHTIDNLSTIWAKLYRLNTVKKGLIVSDRLVGTSEDTIFNIYALDNSKISYINRCFYHYRKSNAQSITSAYKKDLVEKWDVMYHIMQEYINNTGKVEAYHEPFLNRVACGMIGLGLNELGSSLGIRKISLRLREILERPLYREAFEQLDVSCCTGKWKLFFYLCKKKHTLMLTCLLRIMNYLRSRTAG